MDIKTAQMLLKLSGKTWYYGISIVNVLQILGIKRNIIYALCTYTKDEHPFDPWVGKLDFLNNKVIYCTQKEHSSFREKIDGIKKEWKKRISSLEDI